MDYKKPFKIFKAFYFRLKFGSKHFKDFKLKELFIDYAYDYYYGRVKDNERNKRIPFKQ